MSVITLDMIEAWAKYFDVSLEDGSQLPGVIGSLRIMEAGEGSNYPAALINGNPVFDALRVAYAKAIGIEEPESWEVPLTPLDEGKTDVMAEKLPEEEKAAE